MKRIVKGNDFTLRIPVMKQVDGQKVPFPIPACTDVQVRVCNQFRRTELAYEVDVADDNVILARVEGDKMGVGTYAVEVRGKLLGNDWRSEEYPQFQIVARNADSDTEFGETDEGDNSVEMDTALVILPPSVELTDAIGDAKEAVAKAEEATEKAEQAIESAADTSATIGAAESERAKAESQREEAEAARKAAEAARVTAEEARTEAEQKREADTDAAVAKCEQASASANAAATKADTATSNANNATASANAAVAKCEQATEAANEAAASASVVGDNVNAELSDDNVFTVTNASGEKKTLDLADAASVSEMTAKAARASLALGHYSDRDDIVLTATETNKAISSDGVKVNKSGWAIAEFTAEKGNEYLFKPGTTDGSVCVFAEYIDKVEDRAIDYTYTYNSDGTTATATATYGVKTYTYTYTWATDTGGNTVATIKDASGNVVTSLPLLYTTTVGTYSPLVRLNADAELPTDGYCRFMSHFQGNNALKVVVSYKVGSADLTMKVLRDGVFASISTQLGNLSQKQSQTESEIAAMRQSYVDIYSIADGTVQVDGKNVSIAAKTKTRLYPKVEFIAYALGKNLKVVNAKHLDTSGFTTFNNNWQGMFMGCSSLTTLDVSGWDTSNVTSMYGTFYGCSSLTTLDVSGWDTNKVTNMVNMFNSCSKLTTLDVSGWDTSKLTSMNYMFANCSSLTTLDVSGWDTSKVTSMVNTFYGCSSLTTLDVSGWDTSKVTNMGGTFNNCSSLTTLDVSGWDTSKVTSMHGTFERCSSLTTLDVSGWDTSKVTSMHGTFERCSSLTTLDVSGWDTSKVTSMVNMFANCSSLTTLDVSGWDTSKLTSMNYMFANCSSLTSLIGSHTLEEVEAGEVVALRGTKVGLSLSASTKLDRKNLLAVIKGLADLTGGTSQTLTLGNTLKAKLTSDDIAIATAKNWTIA